MRTLTLIVEDNDGASVRKSQKSFNITEMYLYPKLKPALADLLVETVYELDKSVECNVATESLKP